MMDDRKMITVEYSDRLVQKIPYCYPFASSEAMHRRSAGALLCVSRIKQKVIHSRQTYLNSLQQAT